MNIGIYFAYGSTEGGDLGCEGLGRYLAQLVRAFLEKGCGVTIACPQWLIEPVERLLEGLSIPTADIRYITAGTMPVMLRLKRGRAKRHRDESGESILRRAKLLVKGILKDVLMWVSQITSWVLFVLVGLLAVVAGIVLLPFAVAGGLLWLLAKAAEKLFRVDLSTKSVISLLKRVKRKLGNIKRRLWNTDSDVRARESVCAQLVKKINTTDTGVDVWYSPTAFWPEFNEIEGPRVCCFPDLCTSRFSEGFSESVDGAMSDLVRKTVRGGKYFITYSEYQRRDVLAAEFGKPLEDIRAINLFVNDCMPFIDVTQSYDAFTESDVDRFSRMVIANLPPHATTETHEYLSSGFIPYDFRGMRYIFYSSQNRPNKNIITLVKAFEYLLRERDADFRLVLTARPEIYAPLDRYLEKHNLRREVLTFSGVSAQELAALYRCAELVVTPTFFEGGFPMTFAEGMSVGTPSIMSRIPQVTDMLDGRGLDDCLFDPFDYKDLAAKIEYGISHRAELIERQRPFYEELAVRTRDTAADEYLDAFRDFAARAEAEA